MPEKNEIQKQFEKKEALCKRFGLRNGMFFATYRLKNQIWKLDGFEFGFGDLREEDIFRIQYELVTGEVFEGFNEHHGSDFQQRKNPMIIIKHHHVKYPTR